MKLRILLNLIFLTSFCCFAMESQSDFAKASTDRETFPFGKLPRDIKEEILSWEKIDKSDPQKLAEGLIRSIRQYNAIPKTINKDFYAYITESFNKFLDNLNDEDFKSLNQYISYSLTKHFAQKRLPKDFNLLIRLLKKLNKLNASTKDQVDQFLIWYVVNNRLENLMELIKADGDVNAKDKGGMTALMWAGETGNVEIAKLLIDKKADINAKDWTGRNALMWAIAKHHPSVVKLLIDNGADVNLQNNNGWTALMYASKEINNEIVKLLIDNNADVNAKDNDGYSALMLASEYGRGETVKLLIDEGADVNIKDNDGWAALELAKKYGFENIANLIEAKLKEQQK